MDPMARRTPCPIKVSRRSFQNHVVMNPEPVQIGGYWGPTDLKLPGPGEPVEERLLPVVVVNMTLGTAKLLADMIPLDGPNSTTGNPSIGQPEGFPRLYIPRLFYVASFGGKLNNGSYAPEGWYKCCNKRVENHGR